MKGVAALFFLLALAGASGCHRLEVGRPTTPLDPERFVAFLPDSVPGWTAEEPKRLGAEQSKMRPPASMASREFRRDRETMSVVIVDGGGDPKVHFMYLAERRPDGSRHLTAPLPERNGSPTVERETEDGERELTAVVGGRFIVQVVSRSASAEELRRTFDLVDAKKLAQVR